MLDNQQDFMSYGDNVSTTQKTAQSIQCMEISAILDEIEDYIACGDFDSADGDTDNAQILQAKYFSDEGESRYNTELWNRNPRVFLHRFMINNQIRNEEEMSEIYHKSQTDPDIKRMLDFCNEKLCKEKNWLTNESIENDRKKVRQFVDNVNKIIDERCKAEENAKKAQQQADEELKRKLDAIKSKIEGDKRKKLDEIENQIAQAKKQRNEKLAQKQAQIDAELTALNNQIKELEKLIKEETIIYERKCAAENSTRQGEYNLLQAQLKEKENQLQALRQKRDQQEKINADRAKREAYLAGEYKRAMELYSTATKKPTKSYDQIVSAIEAYQKAYGVFNALKEYKDAKSYAQKCSGKIDELNSKKKQLDKEIKWGKDAEAYIEARNIYLDCCGKSKQFFKSHGYYLTIEKCKTALSLFKKLGDFVVSKDEQGLKRVPMPNGDTKALQVPAGSAKGYVKKCEARLAELEKARDNQDVKKARVRNFVAFLRVFAVVLSLIISVGLIGVGYWWLSTFTSPWYSLFIVGPLGYITTRLIDWLGEAFWSEETGRGLRTANSIITGICIFVSWLIVVDDRPFMLLLLNEAMFYFLMFGMPAIQREFDYDGPDENKWDILLMLLWSATSFACCYFSHTVTSNNMLDGKFHLLWIILVFIIPLFAITGAASNLNWGMIFPRVIFVGNIATAITSFVCMIVEYCKVYAFNFFFFILVLIVFLVAGYVGLLLYSTISDSVDLDFF